MTTRTARLPGSPGRFGRSLRRWRRRLRCCEHLSSRQGQLEGTRGKMPWHGLTHAEARLVVDGRDCGDEQRGRCVHYARIDLGSVL